MTSVTSASVLRKFGYKTGSEILHSKSLAIEEPRIYSLDWRHEPVEMKEWKLPRAPDTSKFFQRRESIALHPEASRPYYSDPWASSAGPSTAASNAQTPRLGFPIFTPNWARHTALYIHTRVYKYHIYPSVYIPAQLNITGTQTRENQVRKVENNAIFSSDFFSDVFASRGFFFSTCSLVTRMARQVKHS